MLVKVHQRIIAVKFNQIMSGGSQFLENSNIFSRGPLDDVNITNIQALDLVVSDEKNFENYARESGKDPSCVVL